MVHCSHEKTTLAPVRAPLVWAFLRLRLRLAVSFGGWIFDWAPHVALATSSVHHSYSPVALWKTYSRPFTVSTPSFSVHFLQVYQPLQPGDVRINEN